MNAKSLRIAAVAASLLAVGASSAAAQVETPARAHPDVAVSLLQTRPLGVLGENIGSGYGIGAAFLLPLDGRGLLSLRADLGAAEYGHEAKRTAFSETVGGRVDVEVRTTNTVVPASVGLQLTPFVGPIRPYLNTGVGALAFYTDSRVEPMGGGAPLASMINQSDIALTWTLGGGLSVPISVGPREVLFDLGAQYIQGGRVQYLAPGSITDLPGGQIEITPMESQSQLVTLHLGARIGL